MTLRTLLLLTLCACLLSACEPAADDEPDDEPCVGQAVTEPAACTLVTRLDGGEAESASGDLKLYIGPMALDEDTEICITSVANETTITDIHLLNPGWRLEPHGTQFAYPVYLEARPAYTGELSSVGMITSSDGSTYEELTVQHDHQRDIVTTEIEHFSWLNPTLVADLGVTSGPPSVDFTGDQDDNGSQEFRLGGSDTARTDFNVIETPTGLRWSNGAGSTETLVTQVNMFPGTFGQSAHFQITMLGDAGPANQAWYGVFATIFNPTLIQPTGMDGVAIIPARPEWINWDLIPVSAFTGSATIDITYLDANHSVVGTDTIGMTIGRP